MNGLRYFILFGILSTQISDAGIVSRFRRLRRDDGGSKSNSGSHDSDEHVITKPLNPATAKPPVPMATRPSATVTTKPPINACNITQRYAEQREFFMKINDPHICDNFLAQKTRIKIEFLPQVDGCLKAMKWLQDTFDTSSTFTGTTTQVYDKIVCRSPEAANCGEDDDDSTKICGKLGDEYRFFNSKCHQCAHSCKEVVRGGEYYKTINNKSRCRAKGLPDDYSRSQSTTDPTTETLWTSADLVGTSLEATVLPVEGTTSHLVKTFENHRGSDSRSHSDDSDEDMTIKPLATVTTNLATHVCNVTQRYAEQREFFMKINDPDICDNFLAQRTRKKIGFLPKVEGCLKAVKWLQDAFDTSSTFTGSSVPVYSSIICPIPGRLCPMDDVGEMVCGKMGNEYRLFRSKCHQCAHSCKEVVRGGEYYKTINNKSRCRAKGLPDDYSRSQSTTDPTTETLWTSADLVGTSLEATVLPVEGTTSHLVKTFENHRGSDSRSHSDDSDEDMTIKPLATVTTNLATHVCNVTQRYAEQREFFMKINDPDICDNFLAQRTRKKIGFLPKVEGCLKAVKWLQDAFDTSSTFTGSSVPVYSSIICPIPGRLCPMDDVGEMVCGKMGNEYRLFRSKCHQCAHSCREVVRGGEYYKTIKDKTRCRDEE